MLVKSLRLQPYALIPDTSTNDVPTQSKRNCDDFAIEKSS